MCVEIDQETPIGLNINDIFNHLDRNLPNLLSIKINFGQFIPQEMDKYISYSKNHTISYEALRNGNAPNCSIYQKLCTFFYKTADNSKWKCVFAEDLQINFNMAESIEASTFDYIIFNSKVSLKINWLKLAEFNLDAEHKFNTILNDCKYNESDAEGKFILIIDCGYTFWNTLQISNESVAKKLIFHYSKTCMTCIQSDTIHSFAQTIKSRRESSLEFSQILNIENNDEVIHDIPKVFQKEDLDIKYWINIISPLNSCEIANVLEPLNAMKVVKLFLIIKEINLYPEELEIEILSIDEALRMIPSLKEIDIYFSSQNKKIKIRGDINEIISNMGNFLRGLREYTIEDEISIISSLRLA